MSTEFSQRYPDYSPKCDDQIRSGYIAGLLWKCCHLWAQSKIKNSPSRATEYIIALLLFPATSKQKSMCKFGERVTSLPMAYNKITNYSDKVTIKLNSSVTQCLQKWKHSTLHKGSVYCRDIATDCIRFKRFFVFFCFFPCCCVHLRKLREAIFD